MLCFVCSLLICFVMYAIVGCLCCHRCFFVCDIVSLFVSCIRLLLLLFVLLCCWYSGYYDFCCLCWYFCFCWYCCCVRYCCYVCHLVMFASLLCVVIVVVDICVMFVLSVVFEYLNSLLVVVAIRCCACLLCLSFC